jgi:hypothetical protein
MEEKRINVAELLKDCPKGMEINCLMYDGCTFKGVTESEDYPIKIQAPDGSFVFTKYGSISEIESAKCVIFPKDKTTWEGFVPPYKFKLGHNIRMKGTAAVYTVTEIQGDCYKLDDKDITLLFKNQDQWELVPNKFDITTLKPFDRVLVRDFTRREWTIEFFSHIQNEDYMFACHYSNWAQCVPYEGNEHLLNTTQDCADFYITWNN